MDLDKMPRKLWEHPNPKSTIMWHFMQESNKLYNLNMNTFQELYAWSINNRVQFWSHLWTYIRWIHSGSSTRVVDETAPIDALPKWFPDVTINFAENFLYSPSASGEPCTLNKEDDLVAITEIREGNTEVRHVTWKEFRAQVHALAAALHERGLKVGDRVVVVGAHSLTTCVVMLATMWLGGVFSSSSTDMGVGGLLQRTVQIDPKFVFFDDGALYNGKVLDLREKITGMVEGLKECANFSKMIIIQRFKQPYSTTSIPHTERLESLLSSTTTITPPQAIRLPFQAPSIIYYSSGTTGIPKAIVHAAGPLLLNVGKEATLHRGMKPSDVGLQYTTTGWIMYLASVGHLIRGGRAVFYDGSPFVPDLKTLLRVTEEQGVTCLGISPRWMGELMKAGVVPKKEFKLKGLKWIGSTGMVLSDQLFEWFYDVGFEKDTHLCNNSGGTDIAGCFAIDNPLTPVYVGGCQGPGLGTPFAVYPHDAPPNTPVQPLPAGTPGDLVSPASFPNTPIYLWNDSAKDTADNTPPGPKYKAAYFARYPHVWSQGDFCVVHPLTGNIILLGRSDGVLNPSGVRFGSSDIYAVVEKFFSEEVGESICVGQRRKGDLDERVVLFLLMRPGKRLDGELVDKIRGTVARELTKRHVPSFIFEMPEVPVTVNMKKVELPVKHIISGATIKPSGTLLNPQSLEYFYQFQEIEKVTKPRAKL